MGIFDTLQEKSTFSRASGNNYHITTIMLCCKSS